VQAELRRLAHRADEQQQAQAGHRIDAHPAKPIVDPAMPGSRRGSPNRNRAEDEERPEDAEAETEVADAVDHERLHRRGIGDGL
jgi:hypothetical protein